MPSNQPPAEMARPIEITSDIRVLRTEFGAINQAGSRLVWDRGSAVGTYDNNLSSRSRVVGEAMQQLSVQNTESSLVVGAISRIRSKIDAW